MLTVNDLTTFVEARKEYQLDDWEVGRIRWLLETVALRHLGWQGEGWWYRRTDMAWAVGEARKSVAVVEEAA